MKSTSSISLQNTTSRAFTLIELLIVLVIVSTLAGLVGPMAINNLERAEAKTELLKTKNWIKHIGHMAFTFNQELTLQLDGKEARLLGVDETLIQSQTFEHVFFQPQSLTVNENGLFSQATIIGQYRDRPLTLTISSLENSDEAS